MKKILFVLLAPGLVACGAPAAKSTLTSSPSVTVEPAVVTFADPVLEAMVRGTMGKPEGDIWKLLRRGRLDIR